MSTPIRFLALSALIVLTFDSFQNIESAVTSNPSKTNKPSNIQSTCAKYIFSVVSTCCKSTPTDLFDKAFATGCKKMQSAANLAIFKEYNFNRLQTGATTYSFTNLGSKIVFPKINAESFCFAECLFNNNSLIVDGAVDYDATKTYLGKQVTSTTWKDIVTGAVDTCKTKIEDAFTADDTKKTVKMLSNSFKTCITTPAMLLQCILGTVIKSCPEGSTLTTTACTTRLANFNSCDPFAA
ncbi:uncharacterized protein LOC132201398 [Neocloeon triangulifer]|uniref:uncharacterized protein LOC132201398 n=1 Tax=Neocloeon triangulifer TaxID=2078957 RepID=UPI00286F642C|nr:uncharacterized protein LOC132201398 [Neocloeon triangulifer]